MAEHQWVRGPALEVVRKLNGIKPGDEVEVTLNRYIGYDMYDGVMYGEVVQWVPHKDIQTIRIGVRGKNYELVGIAKYITAWRPKHCSSFSCGSS